MMQRKYSFFMIFAILSLIAAFFCPGELSASEKINCKICKKQIRPGQRYLISKNEPYCSRKCYEQILPECTVCRKRSYTGGIYALDHSFFACTECMKKPRCFSCQIPTDDATLSCSRAICKNCLRTSISNSRQAQALFNEVRDTMRLSLGIGTRHPIRFTLVDPDQLQKLSGNPSDNHLEQGLFKYEAEIEKVVTRDYLGRKKSEKTYAKNENRSIFALDHLPKIRMEYVIAHELAHDWQAEFYPGIRDLKIKEGLAEYIAWRYNRFKKRHDLNRRIENNPDPIYGEGFRQIKRIADKNGFAGLKKYLQFKSDSKHVIRK